MSFGPSEVDVLIAGAGPAGLSAALHLLDAGATVQMVDVRRRIGTPLRCGELTRSTLFEAVGIEPQDGWIRQSLEKHGGAVVINRQKMEGDLADLLVERGTFIATEACVVAVGEFDGFTREVIVETETERKKIKARCVIAADGVSSRVAHMCGINTYLPMDQLGTCLAHRYVEIELKFPDTYIINYIPDRYPYYLWLIPSGPRQANIGMVLPAHQGFRLKTMLEERLKATKLFAGGLRVQTIAGVYPVTEPLPKPFADGLLVTGTAARLVDRRIGEGIWFAAASGKSAAATIIEAKSTTAEDLAVYREKIEPLYRDLKDKWESRELKWKQLSEKKNP